jgi:hypothetical protein
MTQNTSILHAKAIFGIQCVLIGGLSDLYRDIFVTAFAEMYKESCSRTPQPGIPGRAITQQSTELANFPSDSFDIPDLHESGLLRTDKRGE